MANDVLDGSSETGFVIGPADPGERGSLVVRDKVAQRLAVHAARLTKGVHEVHSTGLGKLTGRELPRATVWIAGDRARVEVTIAVTWPQPAIGVGMAVQRNITDALSNYAALTVDRVDVAIDAVLPDVAAPARTVQ